jgi:uncharacterized repeat protein (TIGR01451 family)
MKLLKMFSRFLLVCCIIAANLVFFSGQVRAFSEVKLSALDGLPGDEFGYSVDISEDTAIVGVGTYYTQGSAYIYIFNGTNWVLQQKLAAGDGVNGDWFGCSVAISGDTAVVGACHKRINGQALQGAVYVFVRSGGTWTQQQELTAGDGAKKDTFGCSVDISGNTLIAGAQGDTFGIEPSQGSAYIFTRSGTSWTQAAKFTTDIGGEDVYFGHSASISGDTAIVGAYFETPGPGMDECGAAYVYFFNGTNWVFQQKLVAPDWEVTAGLGFSVAISGDTAIAGAYADDSGINYDLGSAYIYVRSGGTWTLQQKLVAPDGADYDWFGCSVAINGDLAIAGAQNCDIGINANQGAAYLFTRSGSTWTQKEKLSASDGASGDTFGFAVSINGDRAMAGAYLADIGTNEDQGAAYIYSGINKTDLSITKTGDSGVVTGTGFSYTLTVTNNGPNDASGVKATDLLPSGVTYRRSTPSQGDYNPSTGIWTIGSLTNGENVTLEIEVTASSLPNTVITNTAQVSGNQTDPDASNNSSSRITKVAAAVGGEVERINQIRILLPWIISGAVLAVLGARVLLKRQKAK